MREQQPDELSTPPQHSGLSGAFLTPWGQLWYHECSAALTARSCTSRGVGPWGALSCPHGLLSLPRGHPPTVASPCR